MQLPPPASIGDRILPAFNSLRDYVASWKWIPGPGVSIAEGSNGTAISFFPPRIPWEHSWRVSFLPDERISVGWGLVNGIPIKESTPEDPLPATLLDKVQCPAWVFVVCSDKGERGKTTRGKRFALKASATALQAEGSREYHPLAYITREKAVHQICYFDLQHAISGEGAHFYWI